MNNLTVTKANQLIDASYKLNVQAQKLLLACIAKLDSREEIPRQIRITASEFGELMGVTHNARRDLYKAADTLFDAVITITDDTETTRLRWVEKDVKKHRGEGAVTIFWTEEVLKYLSQLKRRFTSYKLKQIALLQSAHSIRLYELLMRFKTTGVRLISVADFKSALGLCDKYPAFKELSRRVINPAVAELNQHSDLSIDYQTIKTGKIISALKFDFH